MRFSTRSASMCSGIMSCLARSISSAVLLDATKIDSLDLERHSLVTPSNPPISRDSGSMEGSHQSHSCSYAREYSKSFKRFSTLTGFYISISKSISRPLNQVHPAACPPSCQQPQPARTQVTQCDVSSLCQRHHPRHCHFQPSRSILQI